MFMPLKFSAPLIWDNAVQILPRLRHIFTVIYHQKSYGTALFPNLVLQCSVVEMLYILIKVMVKWVCLSN